MSFEAWIIFAVFWAVFVTTPGPHAVNCINNGMTLGFRRIMAGSFIIYGLLLGSTTTPGRA